VTDHTTLSQVEICNRLSAIRQGEAHLRNELDLDNPHNAVLRLRDLARYIGVTINEVWLWFPDMWRSTHRLVTRPAPKKAIRLPLERQRAFSNFFHAWDRGLIVKARVGDEWRICHRHQDESSLGATARPQADTRVITMKIDRDTLGLRFK
jgi:hypothetical protein